MVQQGFHFRLQNVIIFVWNLAYDQRSLVNALSWSDVRLKWHHSTDSNFTCKHIAMKSRTNCYFNHMQFVTRLLCTVFVIASVCHSWFVRQWLWTSATWIWSKIIEYIKSARPYYSVSNNVNIYNHYELQ